jgi:flavin reductase (DIM6/NTAB) family NADH-FMN oxidoreductase RutF
MTAKKVQTSFMRPVFPSPAALITCVDAAGKANIITLGEVFNLSVAKPVIVGIAIAPMRYSHEMIRTTREFVVNLPRASMLDQVLKCGTSSGRVVDKFKAFGLTPLRAAKVRPPLIAECPVNIECELMGEPISIGDHDLFRGLVVAKHVDEECLTSDGKVDVEKTDMLIFAEWGFWSAGRRIGEYARKSKAVEKKE